jgi:hypothetical protein
MRFLVRIWVRLSSLIAAVGALREKSQGLHDRARASSERGQHGLAKEQRDEADEMSAAAKDLEGAKYRALDRDDGLPPGD